MGLFKTLCNAFQYAKLNEQYLCALDRKRIKILQLETTIKELEKANEELSMDLDNLRDQLELTNLSYDLSLIVEPGDLEQ